MTLAELSTGEEAVIAKVKGYGAFRRRILEMGFLKGKIVKVIKNAPLKDPIEYQILNYNISLRRAEAHLIEVVPMSEIGNFLQTPFLGTSEINVIEKAVREKRKTINVALVGNPNCGKTTIFNQVSGSYEHVGNYSGVTVDVKTSTFEFEGYTIHLSDLPGTYSLSAYSPEEVYVRTHISEDMPDIVINVVDGANLERNLYLTTQLMHMDIKLVMALNMYDDLQKRGDTIDYKHLGNMLGMPIVPTVGSRSRGINKLLKKVIDVYEDQIPEAHPVKVNLGNHIEQSVEAVEKLIQTENNLKLVTTPRFMAIKLLEGDKGYSKYIKNVGFETLSHQVAVQQEKIEKTFNDDIETVITDARYGFIAGALKETYRENPVQRRRRTDAIDFFLTHKLFGFPVFFLFMFLMFQATFTLGEYPMEWIEAGVEWVSQVMNNLLPDGSFKDLVINGVIGGVGGVIVFLPNILILFFFISFMEDTGYMARAAFIMDKVMNKIGLHGKSFIPLIMGFGCNVPAIMATRTIEDRNSRLLTILINPFMSCSARLPVYILFIAAFFPENPGTLLFILYGTGILIAVVIARIFKKFLFKRENVPFVMELPPYRLPTLKSTIRHMWHKGEQYLRKMGGIIMIASIIIWFLGYFPRESSHFDQHQNEIVQVESKYEILSSMVDSEDSAKELKSNKKEELNQVYEKEHRKQQEESYIGRMGHAVEPLIRPLGFDWKMGISILSGVAAKEIVVSTIAVLYHSPHLDEDKGSKQLISSLRDDTYEDGTPVFTPLVALSFLVFILIYFPCVAVIAAIKKEAGSWKWAMFTVFYTTALAWIMSFAVYQIGSLFV